MPKLLLFVYGLVAFVPQQAAPRWSILLPDAQYPALASPGCWIHAHLPAVIFYVGKPTIGEAL